MTGSKFPVETDLVYSDDSDQEEFIANQADSLRLTD